jgi:hypothetical protein
VTQLDGAELVEEQVEVEKERVLKLLPAGGRVVFPPADPGFKALEDRGTIDRPPRYTAKGSDRVGAVHQQASLRDGVP